jgi:hypothetical protein
MRVWLDRAMTRYLHTMYRITDPGKSRAFYEALGLESAVSSTSFGTVRRRRRTISSACLDRRRSSS